MELFCVPRYRCGATKTWKILIHTVVFLFCIQRTLGQGSSPQVIASVGATVTLPAPVTANIDTFTWYRGTAGIAAQRIFTYKPSASTQGNGPQYTGREEGLSDGSLQIRGARTSDTGNYTVILTLNDLSVPQGTTQLRVYGTGLGHENGDNGPPVGVIVGAVIGALLLVAIVGALVYFFVFKKPVSGTPTSNNSMDAANSTKPASTNAKAAGNGEELQYSSVNFVPKPGIPMKPITTDTTVYSEVRRQ